MAKKQKTVNKYITQRSTSQNLSKQKKYIEHLRSKIKRSSSLGQVSSSLLLFQSMFMFSPVGALHAALSVNELLLFLLSTLTGWSLMVPFTSGSSLDMRSLSGAGFVTMPMKRGTREASSTKANRKGELTENMEMERRVVTTVAAEAFTPSSLSSTVLAWRTLPTLRGLSEIPERLGPENREPRPDGKTTTVTESWADIKIQRKNYFSLSASPHPCLSVLPGAPGGTVISPWEG